MRHILISTICLLLIATACFRTKEPDTPMPVVTEQQAVETQRHINRFFHKNIIPAIDSQWNAITDSGKSVTYHYIFLRNDKTWQFNGLERNESTLSSANDSIALAIMSNAMMRTSMPVEERLAGDSIFHLYWSWPVPFPEGNFDENTGEFVYLQNNGGGTGGCDGKGTQPHCKACTDKFECINVCVGYEMCSATRADCWEIDSNGGCASGGPFGKFKTNFIL